MLMNESKIQVFLEEYREENHVSPFRNDSEFLEYIKDGIADIDDYCGSKIDYETDRIARRLLKNYVLYADYKKLAEFKEIYIGEYDALQRNYFIKNDNSSVQ